jgi:hypothetical protein
MQNLLANAGNQPLALDLSVLNLNPNLNLNPFPRAPSLSPLANRHIPAYSGTPWSAGLRPGELPVRKHPQPVVYPPYSAGILPFEFCILNSLVPLRGFIRLYPTLRDWTPIFMPRKTA